MRNSKPVDTTDIQRKHLVNSTIGVGRFFVKAKAKENLRRSKRIVKCAVQRIKVNMGSVLAEKK